MKHPFVFASQLAIFCAAAALWCTLSTSSAQSRPAATPAAPSSTAPQSTAPAANTAPTTDPATSDPSASAAARKTKKVWTNEDVSGISSPISVVGDAKNPKSKNSQQAPPDASYISSVRKQMQKFQDQMTAIDKELATLKNFSEGEPVATADREFHKSYNNEPIAQQVTTLQTKKLDLQSKIDALLDEARKKGVEPGQLR
ncbi:MAG: hypothetical protein ABSG69_01675 [Candidatus Acidiferrum sp.]